MTSTRWFGVLLATALGLAETTSAPPVLAQGAQPGVLWSGAPTTKKAIVLPFPRLRWGMSPKQVAAEVERLLEKDYRQLMKQAGADAKKKRELEMQLEELKAELRRSRIDFGSLPTGLDASYFRGEYTYNNKESVLTFKHEGEKFLFFFIQDKLWKVMVESHLSEEHPLGKTFAEAVGSLGKRYGNGRVTPADFDGGRWTTEVDWKDNATHLRAVQASETAILLAYEDIWTLQNLGTLRKKQ